jgi:hypothetical protein
MRAIRAEAIIIKALDLALTILILTSAPMPLIKIARHRNRLQG